MDGLSGAAECVHFGCPRSFWFLLCSSGPVSLEPGFHQVTENENLPAPKAVAAKSSSCCFLRDSQRERRCSGGRCFVVHFRVESGKNNSDQCESEAPKSPPPLPGTPSLA